MIKLKNKQLSTASPVKLSTTEPDRRNVGCCCAHAAIVEARKRMRVEIVLYILFI